MDSERYEALGITCEHPSCGKCRDTVVKKCISLLPYAVGQFAQQPAVLRGDAQEPWMQMRSPATTWSQQFRRVTKLSQKVENLRQQKVLLSSTRSISALLLARNINREKFFVTILRPHRAVNYDCTWCGAVQGDTKFLRCLKEKSKCKPKNKVSVYRHVL